MPSYTYTTYWEECSRDSYKNNCDANCCQTFSGGITPALQMCSPALQEDVSCQDSFTPVTTTANTCTTDDAGNTCATSCCMTIDTSVSCAAQAYCSGYNLDAYTRDNIINYGKVLGVSISPVQNTQNSASAIGGIITFGVLSFILLIVIVITLCQLIKIKKQNHLISYHSQRESGKHIQSGPLINPQV